MLMAADINSQTDHFSGFPGYWVPDIDEDTGFLFICQFLERNLSVEITHMVGVDTPGFSTFNEQA
jgi:hypothetical protein